MMSAPSPIARAPRRTRELARRPSPAESRAATRCVAAAPLDPGVRVSALPPEWIDLRLAGAVEWGGDDAGDDPLAVLSVAAERPEDSFAG